MVLPSEVASHTYTNTSNIVSLLSVHGILYIHSMPDVHKEYFATGFTIPNSIPLSLNGHTFIGVQIMRRV